MGQERIGSIEFGGTISRRAFNMANSAFLEVKDLDDYVYRHLRTIPTRSFTDLLFSSCCPPLLLLVFDMRIHNPASAARIKLPICTTHVRYQDTISQYRITLAQTKHHKNTRQIITSQLITMSNVIIAITFITLAAFAHALPMLDADDNSQGTPTTSIDTMQSPTWLHAATVPLVCYDIIAVGAFCWLYACGYMAWMKRNEDMERAVDEMHRVELQMRGGWRPGRATLIEGEMRRLGMW